MESYEEAMNAQFVDHLSSEQAYEEFLKAKKGGLGEQMGRLFDTEHDRRDTLKLKRLVSLVLMGIGLLVAGVAALWPRRRVESADSGYTA
jgi:hypothetical protein